MSSASGTISLFGADNDAESRPNPSLDRGRPGEYVASQFFRYIWPLPLGWQDLHVPQTGVVARTDGSEPKTPKLYHEGHKAVGVQLNSLIDDRDTATNRFIRRIQEKTDRKDFMSYLLTAREGVSDVQLAAHASDFV